MQIRQTVTERVLGLYLFFLCRYPADQKAFTFSGLKGDWDRERAGQRMKLKDAETWERLLSQEGNKAATWEKLIGINLIFLNHQTSDYHFYSVT